MSKRPYEKPYVIDKGRDDFGNTFWYCHNRRFPNIPVFGSIGSYQKAKSVCDTYNCSVGAIEKKGER